MNVRTPEERKAYVDGYNACYRDYIECLRSIHITKFIAGLVKMDEKMKMLKTAVNNTLEEGDNDV
jgi:hypothetical protein